ncbi:hypothetical protein C8Q73DRAFT_786939 [Cubamyces lactineus]|nr:hypothetical protein C8Q73DRAFT_786939 [Cubamyces lactineus]
MAGKVTLRPVPSHPDILLALDLMSTTEPRFHWYLFIPDAPTTSPDRNPHGGIKLHAITNGKQGEEKRWSYDRTPLSLATSPAVAAAAIIGRLPQGKTVDDLDALLQGIALEVPEVDREREPVFTCRVWIREALRRMHAGGYIARNDVDAMEEEMWGYGKAAAAQIEDDTFECAVLEDAMNI